jgi:predicted Zn-ribbon and HTH transcriptional regulator
MKCPKCQTELLEAALGPFAPLLKVVKKGDAFAEKTGIGTVLRGSDIKPYYCPSCGYLEFYVVEPERLK